MSQARRGLANAGKIGTLTNSGTVNGGAGRQCATHTGGAGGAGIANSNVILGAHQHRNRERRLKGSGMSGVGGAGGAAILNSGTIASLTNSGKISGGTGGGGYGGGTGGVGINNSRDDHQPDQ